MNKLAQIVLIAVGAVAVPVIAAAGRSSSPGVTMTTVVPNQTNAIRVEGSMLGARNSADSHQRIGCQLRYDFGYCSATNASNQTWMCSSSDPGFLLAAASAGPASQFRVDMKTGACINIEVRNDSQYLPYTGSSPLVNQ